MSSGRSKEFLWAPSMAGTASQQCEAILLGMAQASEADLHASRYHGNAMLPMIVGGLGVGLIALRAIDALRERSMTRKAENLLCEVAPATRSNGKDSPACGPTYRNVIAEKEFPPLDGITTLYELFKRSASTYPNNPCLGTRKHDVSFYRVLSTTTKTCMAFVRGRRGLMIQSRVAL